MGLPTVGATPLNNISVTTVTIHEPLSKNALNKRFLLSQILPKLDFSSGSIVVISILTAQLIAQNTWSNGLQCQECSKDFESQKRERKESLISGAVSAIFSEYRWPRSQISLSLTWPFSYENYSITCRQMISKNRVDRVSHFETHLFTALLTFE